MLVRIQRWLNIDAMDVSQCQCCSEKWFFIIIFLCTCTKQQSYSKKLPQINNDRLSKVEREHLLCYCHQCSLQTFSYTWCKMNKCQLAKKLHMVLINLHLVLAILFGLQCVLKVWIYTWWYGSYTVQKFTHGGSSLYQRYTWCSHQVCYTLARTLIVTQVILRTVIAFSLISSN